MKKKLTQREKVVKSLSKKYGIDLFTSFQWYERRMSCNLHREPNSKMSMIQELYLEK